jgi:hypothetical protein
MTCAQLAARRTSAAAPSSEALRPANTRTAPHLQVCFQLWVVSQLVQLIVSATALTATTT